MEIDQDDFRVGFQYRNLTLSLMWGMMNSSIGFAKYFNFFCQYILA